jgi:hypothetical protein
VWWTDSVDVLALELGDEFVEAFIVGLDSDGREDLLDVGGGGRGVASDLEEEVGSNVTHFRVVFCVNGSRKSLWGC